MSSRDADGPDSIAGMPVEEAVDVVLDRGEEHERTTARERLEPVVADGVVSREALDDQAAEVSKVVATVETRVELAEQAYEEAAAAADPVDDLDVVAGHLDRFESELDALREWRDRVAARLDDAVDRKSWGTVYETATELGEVRATATNVQRGADELSSDLESFERWLATPEHRYEEVEADIDALEGSIGDVAAGVDRLADAVEADRAGDGGDGTGSSADASTGSNADESAGSSADEGAAAQLAADDLGAAWADTVMRVRVLALFVDDVRAELAELRTWAEREGAATEPVDDLEERLTAVSERREGIADRVDGLARSEWRDGFADELDAFSDELEEFEPPVAWGAVQETLEDYRAALGAS